MSASAASKQTQINLKGIKFPTKKQIHKGTVVNPFGRIQEKVATGEWKLDEVICQLAKKIDEAPKGDKFGSNEAKKLLKELIETLPKDQQSSDDITRIKTEIDRKLTIKQTRDLMNKALFTFLGNLRQDASVNLAYLWTKLGPESKITQSHLLNLLAREILDGTDTRYKTQAMRELFGTLTKMGFHEGYKHMDPELKTRMMSTGSDRVEAPVPLPRPSITMARMDSSSETDSEPKSPDAAEVTSASPASDPDTLPIPPGEIHAAVWDAKFKIKPDAIETLIRLSGQYSANPADQRRNKNDIICCLFDVISTDPRANQIEIREFFRALYRVYLPSLTQKTQDHVGSMIENEYVVVLPPTGPELEAYQREVSDREAGYIKIERSHHYEPIPDGSEKATKKQKRKSLTETLFGARKSSTDLHVYEELPKPKLWKKSKSSSVMPPPRQVTRASVSSSSLLEGDGTPPKLPPPRKGSIVFEEYQDEYPHETSTA